MTRFADKTFRSSEQWVKVTRDNKEKTFCFARGYKNEFQAHDIETLTFKWVANWKEAQDHAERMMAAYA